VPPHRTLRLRIGATLPDKSSRLSYCFIGARYPLSTQGTRERGLGGPQSGREYMKTHDAHFRKSRATSSSRHTSTLPLRRVISHEDTPGMGATPPDKPSLLFPASSAPDLLSPLRRREKEEVGGPQRRRGVLGKTTPTSGNRGKIPDWTHLLPPPPSRGDPGRLWANPTRRDHPPTKGSAGGKLPIGKSAVRSPLRSFSAASR